MDSLYSQFKNFHVFKKFRSLISSWWNIDVFLIEKTKEGFFFDTETQLNNKVVQSLMHSELFKNYFLQSLKQKEILNSEDTLSLKWKQADLDILVAPLILKDSLEGFIVATGFLNSSNPDPLHQALGYLKFSKEEIEKVFSELKSLNDFDKNYIKKFLSILSQECFQLIQERQKQQEVIKKFRGGLNVQNYENIIGKSPAMQFLYNILDKIKTYESPLLIRGEVGTGKKLLAEAIHNHSLRSKKAYFVQNCSLFNDTLLESELFGHKKGAFKGASEDKKGLFEVAEGGSLLLEEVGDLSLELQSKLLRVLQDGTFFSLGDSKAKKSNVRILASSHKNLEEMIQKNLFRKDLFYRLNVISVKVASLRERKEDIPLLVQHFLKEKSPFEKKQFSPQAMECFYNYSWPGNVQELANEIERVLVLSGKNQTFLTEKYLSQKIKSNKVSLSEKTAFRLGQQSLKSFLRSIEKDIITEALKEAQGNKTKVAKWLGSSRTSIILKTKEYGLEDFEESS